MTVFGKTRRQLHRLQRAWGQATLALDTGLVKLPHRLRATRRLLRRALDNAIAATGNKLLARLPLDPVILCCAALVGLAFMFAIQRQPAGLLQAPSAASSTTGSGTISIQLASHATDNRNDASAMSPAVQTTTQAQRATPTAVDAETLKGVGKDTPPDTADVMTATPPLPEKISSIATHHFPGDGGERISLSDLLARKTRQRPGHTTAAVQSTHQQVETSIVVDTREAIPVFVSEAAPGHIVKIPHRNANSELVRIEPIADTASQLQENRTDGLPALPDPALPDSSVATAPETREAGKALVTPRLPAPLDTVALYQIDPSMQDNRFHFYERSDVDIKKFLYELDNVIFTAGPDLAERVIAGTDSDYLYVLAQHKLAIAWHELHYKSRATRALQFAATRAGQISDSAWATIAMADRALTLSRLGQQPAARDAISTADELYNKIENPVQRVVAASGIASRHIALDNQSHGAIYFDTALIAARQLNDDIVQPALRYLALSEADNSLGLRANLHVSRMADGYYKTITALTVSRLLETRDRLAASQQARSHAYSASKVSSELDDTIKQALRRQPASG